ncbi:polysaccharide biosynthesis/export family protein, partial [Chromobacterium piscinae]
YIIGSGDQLQIKGWGMVDIDLTLTVDRNGAIYLPRVGNISVAGVRYRDLQGVLKKSVSRVFNNFDLTVSLQQSRSVQIYV